jgi:hypothetical protein
MDRFCYIHIVKTAGTAFSYHLKSQFSAAEISPTKFWPDLLAMSENERSKYKLISGHFTADISKYIDQQPTNYVTVLRDPIKRTVSVYEFIKKSLETATANHDYGRITPYINKFRRMMGGGIESFIRTDDKDIRLAVSNTQTLVIGGGDPNALPEYVSNDLLENAKNNLNKFAFFGLAERMQDSLDLLSYTFGWRPFKDLVFNVTPQKSHISSLPPRLVNYISDTNRLDLELYEFASALFEERYSKMIKELNQRFSLKIRNSKVELSLNTMLEYHYQQCYRENSAIFYSEKFNKNLGGFPVGEGWWEWEPNGDTGHRWTGPGNVSFLDIPLLKRLPVKVILKIVGAAALDILKNLHIEVNGYSLENNINVDIFGFTVVEVVVPLELLENGSPFVRIKLITNRTVSAKKIDPNLFSDRQIGVAVHSLEVNPIV